MPAGRALVYCAGGGIGDSLIASLVARALRQRYAVVDALTLPGHRATLQHVPDFDEVVIDEGGDERALAAQLASRAYDACIVTWATARTAKVPHLAKIPVRVGQSRRLYSRHFTTRVDIRSERGDTASHWSEIQLAYARALGCDLRNDERVPGFVVADEDEREVDEMLRSLDFGLRPSLGMTRVEDEAAPFAVVHATNAIAAERGLWPVQGWGELARGLCEELGTRVLLTGTEADAAVLEAIVREAPEAISLAGKLSIGGFAALARRAKITVGMGTGTLHVAAAVGARSVALFPMQSDFPERWRPLGERVRVVRASYPCHKGDTKERCPDYACIANLPVKAILATARELL